MEQQWITPRNAEQLTFLLNEEKQVLTLLPNEEQQVYFRNGWAAQLHSQECTKQVHVLWGCCFKRLGQKLMENEVGHFAGAQ
jgi:hypothetical protein